ncbi:MAG: hypothetical protein ACRD20_08335 [Terriglobales bacterium]
MKRLAITIIVITLAGPLIAQEDVSTIIQRSVEANAADWKAAPEYDYLECDQQPDGGSRTYEVRMIVGSPYERLVALNGKPLSREQQAQAQRKQDAEAVERRSESQRERAERIAQYEKDRRRDHVMMDQLAIAFTFTLSGEQKLDGHDVYVLEARPRAGYRPRNRETEVLKGMEGKLWIDEKTFQWVKVEAQVMHPVSIEGFLAQVQPGTHFELEKMPVADGVWLPRHFAMKSQAKVLFFFTHKSQADQKFYDYHKGAPIPGRSP